MARILALDVGTSSVRARVYDERGAFVHGEEARTKYEVAKSRGGGAELDADHLVAATYGVIERVVEPGERVDAVACSCFWHSLLAVDRRGEPCSPLLIWQDTRSAPQAEELARRLDGDAVHARTGCVLHPSYWPAKLAWLRAEHAELWRGATRFLSFADYLYFRLVGDARTSLSTASGTGLLDLGTSQWDDELLDAVGVERKRLPEIDEQPVEAEGRPWFRALADGACSNVGTGCLDRHRATLMIGTSGALRTLFRGPRPQPRHGLFLYRFDAERWVEGGSLSDGGNLHAWLRKTLRLTRTADPAEAEPDAHGLTFLPLLGGERSPGWHGRARGAVAGLTFDTDAADIAQAAAEGVAYRFADILDLMPEVREIVATGGALRAEPGWVQVLADVLGRPVTASAVEEASARGAAVAALERLGLVPEPAPLATTYELRPDRTEVYAAARARQRDLYDRLLR
jgi:gluconokinase